MMQNYIPHFYDATLNPSIVLHLPNNSAGLQIHIPSSKIMINHNPARMEDQSSYSNCKSATPTKPTSSNTIHHANPFTKLIQDINHKRNIETSWNCSLFCTRFLPLSTASALSEQDLTKHMNPTHSLYEFPF